MSTPLLQSTAEVIDRDQNLLIHPRLEPSSREENHRWEPEEPERQHVVGKHRDGVAHPDHQSDAGCVHPAGGSHGHRSAADRGRRRPECGKIVRLGKFRRKVSTLTSSI